MQSQLPNLPPDNPGFRDAARDLFMRIYTDIFSLFDKTAVADPAAMGNEDDDIGGLTFSDPPTQAQCQALRDACETLADDTRALHTTLTALIDSLQARELV